MNDETTGTSELIDVGKQELYRLEPGDEFRESGDWFVVENIDNRADGIHIFTTEGREFWCRDYQQKRPLRKRPPKKPTVSKE